MIDTRSQEAQLTELAAIERRIKRSRGADDLRRAHMQLNKFRTENHTGVSELVRARYFLLRGALYAKAGRNNQAAWLGSSVDCMQYALEQLSDAIEAVRKQAASKGWTGELRDLEQTCTYEAHATISVLRLWNATPGVMFGTDALSKSQRRKEEGSRKHLYSLRSLF